MKRNQFFKQFQSLNLIKNLKVLWNGVLIPAAFLNAITWNCLIGYDQDEFKKFLWVEQFFLNKKKKIITSQNLFSEMNKFEKA